MNSIMSGYYPIFEEYQAMRTQLMQTLTDGDLAVTPGGANPALGVLCRAIGEVERAYINSFKTFTLDFSYRNNTPGLEASVTRLAEWFAALDTELKETVTGLAQADIDGRRIVRGPNFALPAQIQLSTYQEALLIFYGKVMVYLHARGLTPPKQMQDWLD